MKKDKSKSRTALTNHLGLHYQTLNSMASKAPDRYNLMMEWWKLRCNGNDDLESLNDLLQQKGCEKVTTEQLPILRKILGLPLCLNK